MAPIDRREHRQQRVRGAGTTTVQGTFGFNLASLGARPVKQASLPPPRSARKTPNRSTPRAANGSAQRHRSASVQRSGSVKPKSASKNHFSTVTPQLGKRKRGSSQVQPATNNDSDDELSPDREDDVQSIEKSRRAAGVVSPVHEEVDDAPDELSMLQDEPSTSKRATPEGGPVRNGTPASALARKRISTGSTHARTPIAGTISGMALTARRSISRRSKSTERALATPSLLSNGKTSLSLASHSSPALETPSAVQINDESEDELSPQINGATPRVLAKQSQTVNQTPLSNEMEVDELSPAHPATRDKTPTAKTIAKQVISPAQPTEEQTPAPQSAKRGRPRRVITEEEGDDEDETIPAVAPAKTAKRGRPPKNAAAVASEKASVAVTPARPTVAQVRSSRPKDRRPEEDEIDELSPNVERTTLSTRKTARREEITISDGEDSDEYEEPDPDEEPLPTPQLPTSRPSPNQSHEVKPSSEKPPRKRQKFLGPKQAISVMRIKGSSVRGITVADTARTIIEENIERRLTRMAEKLQNCQDSSRRKELRSEINLSLSFRESLNEKLLDLQDANDILSTNLKKLKFFKHDNADLRKNILTLQNTRQELALEHDDVQISYEAEKAEKDARNQLSEDIFEIEAAIQAGRERARDEGREDEGPKVPLTMLLDMVGKDVGSSGRGLLSKVKGFNSMLERAAGWLEGRV